MKKRIVLPIICLVVAVVLLYAGQKFIIQRNEANSGKTGETVDMPHVEDSASEDTMIEAAFDNDGRVSFIDGSFTSQKVTDSSDAAEVLNFASTLFGASFHANAEDFISQPYDDGEFQATYYRYCPSINGVPVLGSQIILSADRDSNVTALFSSYVPEIEMVDTVATITTDEAKDIAVTELIGSDTMLDFLDSLPDETISRENAVNVFKMALDVNPHLAIYAMDDSLPLLVYAVDIETSSNTVDILDLTLYIPDIDKTIYIYANGNNCGTIYTEENHYMAVADEDEISEWVPVIYQLPASYSKYYVRPGHGYEKVPIRIEQNNDEPALYRLHDPDYHLSVEKIG